MTRHEALAIIKANPGCVAELDNDCWFVRKPLPNGWDDFTEDEQDDFWEGATLIRSRDVDGCDYGGGLVEILAIEFEMTTQGV